MKFEFNWWVFLVSMIVFVLIWIPYRYKRKINKGSKKLAVYAQKDPYKFIEIVREDEDWEVSLIPDKKKDLFELIPDNKRPYEIYYIRYTGNKISDTMAIEILLMKLENRMQLL